MGGDQSDKSGSIQSSLPDLAAVQVDNVGKWSFPQKSRNVTKHMQMRGWKAYNYKHAVFQLGKNNNKKPQVERYI